ncbi:MAG TPA: hypothetical protein VMU17_01840, partial [Elusimicrobiota bacterium]|nr:hypothetical protein [Elusimicrobiota bacterium]
FAEPLRATLYAMVTRTTPDYLGENEKDGIDCFDVPDTVSGNWAAQGSDSNWQNSDSWPQQLAFVYDPVYASQIRIVFGGMHGSQNFGPLGSWAVQPGALPPASVTPATGAYGYQIYYWDPSYGTESSVQGLLMAQLLDGETLKVEYFPGTAPGVTSLPFDSNAVTYTR